MVRNRNMEVSPGIFMLELPLGERAVGSVNCYLVRGKRGWTAGRAR